MSSSDGWTPRVLWSDVSQESQATEATEEALRTAIAAMRSAYAQAAAAIEAIPEPQQAFEKAGELRSAADGLVGEAASLRARMVQRIWEAETMSLAALANRIGVSKTRADQFLRTARATGETSEESE
jgi:hypothetical protein